MSEHIEVESLEPEAPEAPETKRTLLEIWREVLTNIEASLEEGATLHAYLRIMADPALPRINDKEFSSYWQTYHNLLVEARAVLADVLDENPDALKNTENDAEDNHDVYLDLIERWQRLTLEWSQYWAKSDGGAALAIAIVKATDFITGPQGLGAHLPHIGFQMSEEERDEIYARLEAHEKE